MLRPIAAAAVVLAFLFSGAPASAEPSAEQVDRRLEFLMERLDDSRTHGRVWHYGWTTVIGVDMVVNFATAAADDSEDVRTQGIVEGGRALIGVVEKFVRPLEARYGADRIRDMPSSSMADKKRQLEAAEAQLEANAERASNRWDWREHAGNLVVNAIAAGIVGGIGDWSDAAMTFGTGFLGGTAQIFSEPWRPSQDWKDYQHLKAWDQRAASEGGLQVVPTVGGVSLHWTF